MASSPPLSPVVATPLGHRKRRHSEMTRDGLDRRAVELTVGMSTSNRHEGSMAASGGVYGSGEDDGVIEEGSEEDDGEVADAVEDILDSAELEPYQADDEDETPGLTAETASQLREYLLKVGPEQFFEAMLVREDISPAILGTAFGLPPSLPEQVGDDIFLQILGQAMVRFFNKRQKLPQYNTIDDAAELLSKSEKIIVITGAGISTSLGIPDFRSKNTGFYSMLQDAGFSEPEEVFDIHEFDQDPTTFYSLVHAIVPDQRKFSPTHAFIRLLQDKGKLLTNYTQNIDNIEERAGIDAHRLIQCHGSFATATCRKCKYKVNGSVILPKILAREVPRCQRCVEDIAAREAAPKKKAKSNGHRNFDGDEDDDESEDDNIPEPGVMKPDITFFGEQLPDNFFNRLTEHDSKHVDLVVVIGTSLQVAPVSDIPNYLPQAVPHIYISREPIKHVNFDVQLLGDCDSVVFELCRRAGWNLTHDMIPNGYRVDVNGVEGTDHLWMVKAKHDTAIACHATTDNSVKVDEPELESLANHDAHDPLSVEAEAHASGDTARSNAI